MNTLYFRCTLLSDVILNQHSASEGANKTLDFIPGSNFLGIAASRLYGQDSQATAVPHAAAMLDLFHSGKVRFGDAHLSEGNQRGYKIPAALFYPKLKGMTDACYIHHAIPDPGSEALRALQLKQCRSGFYAMADAHPHRIQAETTCAIKSAFDREKRRSKDEQLYVYESLQKGLTLLFKVELDDDSCFSTTAGIKQLTEALCGRRRIGRSRTAQYGLVQIEQTDAYTEVQSKSHGQTVLVHGHDEACVTVYADGRLIFLDAYGLPTFHPTAAMLGLPADAEILWEKSQIRTFQYAPWNYKRQCFDADRCGIEKGSVFVVKCQQAPTTSQNVGAYRNEGFGAVIYNPDFLQANAEGISLLKYTTTKAEASAPVADYTDLLQSPHVLMQYVGRQMQDEADELRICKAVNDWVDQNKTKFTKGTFASQWGTIRRLAMQYTDENELLWALYGERQGKYATYPEKDALAHGYLTHGVAALKWADLKRLVLLQEYCAKFKGNLQKALINLSSEMAKQCNQNRKEDTK